MSNELLRLDKAYARINKLLEAHGCSCECSHHEDAAEEWEDHEEDCDPCLACRISEVLQHSERQVPSEQ